jgi:pantoate--beta-alanine ligase
LDSLPGARFTFYDIVMMQNVSEISALRKIIDQWHKQGKRIAFVPTMGNLHQGHLTLVQKAREQGDKIVVSIFVNPTQFDRQEDLHNYPKTLEADIDKLTQENTDLLFTPSTSSMYPSPESATHITVPEISDRLEGASRPGHFSGVATVVAKLFNMVNPDVALFGEKDFQQLMVIKQMVRDLNFNIEIMGVSTVRAADGLALSSRNGYLSPKEREIAPVLYQTLCEIQKKLQSEKNHSQNYKSWQNSAMELLEKNGFKPDYIEIRRQIDLLEPGDKDSKLVILAAAWLGNARLIDNIPVDLNNQD